MQGVKHGLPELHIEDREKKLFGGANRKRYSIGIIAEDFAEGLGPMHMHLPVFVCLLLERLGASAEENLAQQHAGQDESASKGWRHEGALRCLRSSSAQGKSMHHRCTRHANQIAMQAHHRQSQQVAHTLAHASAAVSRSAAFGAASPSLPLKDEAAAMSVCDGGGRRVWARMTRP